MVKPHDEEQANKLSERELKTLFTIFSRYVVDNYKQFKWKITLYESQGSAYVDTEGEIRVKISIHYKGDGTEIVFLGGKRGSGRNQYEQNFPVTGKSPRELGRLARNMFKWVKQQMEKI